MSAVPVEADVDEATLARLRLIAGNEQRAASEVASVALRTMLALSPAARRAIYALDGSANDAERAFAAHLLDRAALQAFERVLDARRPGEYRPAGNIVLDTDEEIEAEAVRLCRP